MYKVAFDTFGCRLNQAETATLHGQFAARGYEVVDDPVDADLFVVNSCTLTSQATAKCRRRIRSVARKNPDACIAAIGCYAQTDAEELATIEGLDYIVGTADKLRLADIIPSPVKLPEPMIVRSPVTSDTFTIDGTGHYPANTRANIKVQEGCDFVCAFCLIPRGRGRARSRDFHDIVREAHALAGAGHRELIVTGVNMGTYRDGRYRFADVVKALADVDGVERVRLSSIEPTTIEDDILDMMASPGSAVCPYMHIPLQSGDTSTLTRMRRRYTAEAFRDYIEKVVAHVPGIGLGTDVIVGFPGEDNAAFENSCSTIMELPFTHVHTFSFSARPRTSAYTMDKQVPPDVIRRRSELMHRIGLMKKAEYYASQEDNVMRVLFETRLSTGEYTGFSDNYVKVAVPTDRELANEFHDVRVTGLANPRSQDTKYFHARAELIGEAAA